MIHAAVAKPRNKIPACVAPAFDNVRQFLLTVTMSDRLATAVQLVAVAVFIAAVIFVVLGSLTFISNHCARGTPFLPTIFPCFERQ
jgi:hypothetical protein